MAGQARPQETEGGGGVTVTDTHERFFRVGGYTGADYLWSLVLSEAGMAKRIARKTQKDGSLTIIMPSGQSFLLEGGRATPVKKPELPL